MATSDPEYSPPIFIPSLGWGFIRDVLFTNGNTYKLRTDEYAVVLSGQINHFTGTTSDLVLTNKRTRAVIRSQINSALGNGAYPFFNTSAYITTAAVPGTDTHAAQQPNHSFIIFSENDTWTFTGDASATADLRLFVKNKNWNKRRVMEG